MQKLPDGDLSRRPLIDALQRVIAAPNEAIRLMAAGVDSEEDPVAPVRQALQGARVAAVHFNDAALEQAASAALAHLDDQRLQNQVYGPATRDAGL